MERFINLAASLLAIFAFLTGIHTYRSCRAPNTADSQSPLPLAPFRAVSAQGRLDPGFAFSGQHIVFSFNPTSYSFAGAVRSVTVAGSFNGWTMSSAKWRATDDDGDGLWQLMVSRGAISCGSHFKFVVNGSIWQQPNRSWPAEHLADDGYGGFNLRVVCE